MRDHRISLRVETETRRCSLVPMSVQLDFGKFFRVIQREQFHPLALRMTDRATGREVPCQFSFYSDEDHLKGMLSWTLLNEAQREFEVQVIEEGSPPSYSMGGIRDRGDK